LVFWARPTQVVRELIGEVQRRLKEAAPSEFISFPFLSTICFFLLGRSLALREG
jgi:hypothetical protein